MGEGFYLPVDTHRGEFLHTWELITDYFHLCHEGVENHVGIKVCIERPGSE